VRKSWTTFERLISVGAVVGRDRHGPLQINQWIYVPSLHYYVLRPKAQEMISSLRSVRCPGTKNGIFCVHTLGTRRNCRHAGSRELHVKELCDSRSAIGEALLSAESFGGSNSLLSSLPPWVPYLRFPFVCNSCVCTDAHGCMTTAGIPVEIVPKWYRGKTKLTS
jgi:hypothetical protein